MNDNSWEKGPMRCPHRPRVKKEGRQRSEPTISIGKHTRAAKHLAATCCTNATAKPASGFVSRRKDSPYRSARSPDWLKSKNPACAAVVATFAILTAKIAESGNDNSSNPTISTLPLQY
jgi:hypothetical protein